MKREPSITEQQAREIVEKMGHRESYTPKSMDDIYRRIGLEPDEEEQPGKTSRKKRRPLWRKNRQVWRPKERQYRRSVSAASSAGCRWRSTRTTYLQVPKIVNRKPVFVSETVRDELDRVVRFLGRKGYERIGVD